MGSFVPSAAVMAVAACASASFGQSLSESFDSGLGAYSNMSSRTNIVLGSGTWIGYAPGNGSAYLSASASFWGTYAGPGAVSLMTNSATQSAWLMTPQLSLYNGATVSFWARSAYGSAYPSRLRLLLSTNGASTTISDFSTTLLSVQSNNPNPTLPFSWTRFTFTLSGLAPNGTTGRLAFEQSAQNFLNQANVLVDEFSYTVVPAPGALALFGAAGLGTRRRRR